MQEDFQTISEFIRRTDALADRKGLNLSEIHPLLGISKAMLFGYRGGKNRITPKVWLKLARAEREAGIISVERVQDEENADHSVNPKQAGVGESAHVVREKLLRERKEEGAGDGHRPPLQEGLEARVARLETALQAIQEALKNL